MDIYDNPITADRHPRLVVWARWFLEAGYGIRTIAELFDCYPHELNMGLEA